MNTTVLKEHTVSIVSPEDGGCIYLQVHMMSQLIKQIWVTSSPR